MLLIKILLRKIIYLKNIVDKDKKIEELKTEIKANNTEIEKYKNRNKEIYLKEKDYIKE